MDLTNEQWELMVPLLPKTRPSGGRGRPPLDQRRILDGILWKLRSGLSWRELPPQYGSHEACFLYYNRWKHSGLLNKITSTLINDVETRGRFDIKTAVKDGVVTFKREGSKFHVYILASYADMWQVSIAMIYYQKIAVKAGNKY